MNTRHAAIYFSELNQLLTLKGENVFRLRALQKAIKSLRATPVEISEFLAFEDNGLGAQLKKQLKELDETGTLKDLETLKEHYPASLRQVALIKGLGAKKIALLRSELGINSLEDLEAAIENDSLFKVKGFGKKSISEMKNSIAFVRENEGYFLLDIHEEVLDELQEIASEITHKIILTPLKESARKSEIFSKLHLALLTDSRETFFKAIRKKGYYVTEEDSDTASVAHPHFSLPIQIEFKDSIIENKEITQYPEQALGVLHAHSTYSDGFGTLEEMAQACIIRGYSYLGISDHSQTASYANGMPVKGIQYQQKEIDGLNERLSPFRILKGIESDILTDGSLDYEDDVLETFDFVIASIHSRFEMGKEEMTKRIITAIKNPYTKILGHPSGRLLLKRKAYELDYDALFEAAAKCKVLIEINANPQRLDLAHSLLKKARDIGVRFCISPDAHNVPQIDFMRYGLLMAEKAGISKSDIANYLTWEEFLETNGY